jgi:hypothetical protein
VARTSTPTFSPRRCRENGMASRALQAQSVARARGAPGIWAQSAVTTSSTTSVPASASSVANAPNGTVA